MFNTFANATFVFFPNFIWFFIDENVWWKSLFRGSNRDNNGTPGFVGYGEVIVKNTVPVWSIFGLTIEKVGYQGTVFPVLAASFILKGFGFLAIF
ncbi:hypothetical protein ABE28_011065 [Peribacillus muralis]|uniref:Uncharacterized protein n=1 Tax=Peribacillus muralis TaxID=264697 RepID=A0A1B3XNU7_9BACI|nr:hypothetical protein ABE28_011065 [Peribacillus muralis]